jgi:hypothetical protein
VNLHVGEVFQKRYESSQYASEVLLFVPEGDADPLRKVNTIRKAMRDLPGGAEFEITHEETEIPGLYRLDLLRPNSTEPAAKEYFAVNLDTAESDLRPMTDEDFQAGFAALRYQVYDPSESMRRSAREQEVLRGREFWQACLGAVLLLLLLETALACFFGRRAS